MVSFRVDIAILFTDHDVHCMLGKAVDLRSYAYMSDEQGDAVFADHANANHVLARIEGRELPQMPLGGPFWSVENINMLRAWISGGFQP